MNCKRCHAQVNEGESSCRWCGAALAKPAVIKKKSQNKKWAIGVGIGAVTIAISLVIIFPLSNWWNQSESNQTSPQIAHDSSKESEDITNENEREEKETINISAINGGKENSGVNQPAAKKIFYQEKDGSIYYVCPNQTTPKLIATNHDYLGDYGYLLGMNEAQTHVFFQQDVTELPTYINGDKYNAFCLNLNKDNEVKYKIGNNIKDCQINQDGTKIFYLVHDGELFCNDFTSKKLIDSGIDSFHISKSGVNVLLSTFSGELNLIRGDKRIHLSANGTIISASEDLETIYYLEGDLLYLVQNGQEPVNLISGVSKVLQINKSGEIYYIHIEDSQQGFMYSDSVSYLDAASDMGTFTLYFYHEGVTKLIQEDCIYAGFDLQDSVQDFSSGSLKKPIMIFSTKGDDNAYYNDISVCIGDKVIGKLPENMLGSFAYDPIKDRIYYISSNQKTDHMEGLYFVDIKENSLSESVRCGEGVRNYEIMDGDVIYNKNYDNNTMDMSGDLYINSKLIDHNVDRGSLRKVENTDSYLYSRFDEENTLILYQEGKKKKIADNVLSYDERGVNEIVYLTMNDSVQLDLYLYDGSGKDKRIRKDIVDLVYPYLTKYGISD